MKEGLYKVEFRTQLGFGFGVVVLQSGQLLGGDAGLYYFGTYQEDGDKLTANVKTNRHSRPPGVQSVFGKDAVTIEIKGRIHGDNITATGTAQEAPGVTFDANLTRLV